MASNNDDGMACLLCKNVVENKDRSVECRICGMTWHSKCLGVKDALVLAMDVQAKKFICYVCDRCNARIEEWWESPLKCEEWSIVGADQREVQHNPPSETESESESDAKGESGATLLIKDIQEMQIKMKQREEETMQTKKEYELLKVQLEKIKGESESEKKKRMKSEEKLKREMEEEKKAKEELQKKFEEKKQDYIENDVLVFINTKMNKLPKVAVLELAGFYTREEVGKAKETLFEVCKNKGAEQDGIKYEERRNSSRRGVQAMDLEDIYRYMHWLQAKLQKEEMPKFVTMDADNRPPVDNKWIDAILINENVGKVRQWIEDLNNEVQRGSENNECGIQDCVGDIRQLLVKMVEDKQIENQEADMRREAEGWKYLELQGRLDRMEVAIREMTNQKGRQIKVRGRSSQSIELQSDTTEKNEEKHAESEASEQEGVQSQENRSEETQHKQRIGRERMDKKVNAVSKVSDQVVLHNGVKGFNLNNEVLQMEQIPREDSSNSDREEVGNSIEATMDRPKVVESRKNIQRRPEQELQNKNRYEKGEENKRINYASVVGEYKITDARDWTEVVSSRHQGRRNVPELKASGRGVKCYIGKCSRNSSVASIKAYVENIVRKELNQEVECMVTELKKAEAEVGWSKSYQVMIPAHIKPLIMVERHWPKGIIVRHFFEKRYRSNGMENSQDN